MKRFIITTIVAISMAVGVSSILTPNTASAQVKSGIDAATSGTDLANKRIDGNRGVVSTVVNILLWAVGAVAVIMIVWGGFRYITSAGDTGKLTAARNTIVYSVVGLIVAILAYAIVRVVMDQFN